MISEQTFLILVRKRCSCGFFLNTFCVNVVSICTPITFCMDMGLANVWVIHKVMSLFHVFRHVFQWYQHAAAHGLHGLWIDIIVNTRFGFIKYCSSFYDSAAIASFDISYNKPFSTLRVEIGFKLLETCACVRPREQFSAFTMPF